VTVHWAQVFLAVALTVYVGAFVTMMAVVKRSTGASPVGRARGHRVAKVLGGVSALLLLVTAVAYILDARSADWFGRIAHLDSPIARSLGAAACVLAGLLLIWGEVSLGSSFRVVLPESKQPLVTRGVYRFVRNPLALSADLLALGVLLLAPTWLALASLSLSLVGYECKIRVEEAYLREAHGAAYVAYCARTGRYLPRLFEGGRW